MATIVLGTIVINRLVGPPLLRLALVRAGEAGRKRSAGPARAGAGSAAQAGG